MPAGRQSKLTPELQKIICDAIAAGNYDYVAAEYAGIHQATFYRWLADGQKAKSGMYHEFYEAVKAASARAETRNVAIIETAAQQSWQAAAWWLERKHYDRWGRKERVQHTGDQENPVKIEVNIESMRELLADDTIRDSLRDSA